MDSKKVVIDFTRYPDGSTTLKIGDRGARVTGDFRPGCKFFNPTQHMLDQLYKVPHVTISSSNGEAGRWQLWQLVDHE